MGKRRNVSRKSVLYSGDRKEDSGVGMRHIYVIAVVTSIFVCIGAFLDSFGLYDKIIIWAGGGASVPITSFGHLLIHGAMESAGTYGLMGLVMGMFNLTASGICSAIIFSFFLSLIFVPKD